MLLLWVEGLGGVEDLCIYVRIWGYAGATIMRFRVYG